MTLIVALVGAVAGILFAGWLANASVAWHQVSSFEGASGYFVVGMAMLGGLIGGAIGATVSRYVDPTGIAGLLRAGVIAVVMVGVVGGVAMGIAWLTGDRPASQGGDNLVLEVEFRFPTGYAPAPDGEWSASLHGKQTFGQDLNQRGAVDPAASRSEGGRWILPARIARPKHRGQAQLRLTRGLESFATFPLPLETDPNRTSEQWSAWLPLRLTDGSAWPDSKVSYRYRQQHGATPKPDPTPHEAKEARFGALVPASSVSDWLADYDYNTPFRRTQVIVQAVEARQAELAALITSADPRLRIPAVRIVQNIAQIGPEVRDAVMAEGDALTAELQRVQGSPAFNTTGDPKALADLRSRFIDWKTAWWSIAQKLPVDGRAPLQRVHDLAARGAENPLMQQIMADTRVLLDHLPPAAH